MTSLRGVVPGRNVWYYEPVQGAGQHGECRAATVVQVFDAERGVVALTFWRIAPQLGEVGSEPMVEYREGSGPKTGFAGTWCFPERS